MGIKDNLVSGFRTALGGTVPSVDNYQSPWGGTDWWGMDGTVDETGVKKKGVYTAAFWLSPPYGRPRDIDYQRLERLEKSVWVRMCVQHIVDSVAGAEWEIVPRVKGADVSNENMAEVQKFFDADDWADGFPTVLKQMLPDMLQYDAGVLLKAFVEKDFDEESGKLKENEDLKPVELYARDGRSFLKDADLFGNLKQYWQYSWINPQGKPIQFSPDEVMYLQQYPVSREPYGMSTLEIIEEILDYLSQSTQAQSKYWTNGMFIGGQIDMPEIKDLDELKRWQAYFEAKLRGPRKFGKWLVTGGGTKVQSLPFTPQQMQWIDSQKWFTKIVFAVFKVAPSELGFTEDLNRATGIQQMEIHKSKAIRPVLSILENAFNRQIVWKYFDEELKFQYVQNLSLDEKAKQTEIDVKRLDAGLDSVNELRDRDGLEKWADEKYNMPIGEGSDDFDSGEEEFDWDALMGKYAKGGSGSGVKGHRNNRADIKPMNDHFADMDIDDVKEKLLEHHDSGEIREMEAKHGEKALRARLQSIVTGKPVSFRKEGEVEDLLKAAMAGAMSGEPGYVPIPYAYDEEGEPKKKVDKALDTIIKQMYEGMKDKVDDSVEYLLREG